MAQWMGQYTGRTHESKVAQIEGTMQAAVAALHAASEADYDGKRFSVEKLAERLLCARLKMLGARIERLTQGKPPDQYAQQTLNLLAKESAASEGGIAAILVEFGVPVAIESNCHAEEDADVARGIQMPPCESLRPPRPLR